MHVDAVEQRSRQLGPVGVDGELRAGAGAQAIAEMATGTGVEGGHQHEVRGKNHRSPRAHHCDRALFEGLPKCLQGRAGEFEQLVEKEHAVVGERDFARPNRGASAGQARYADRVVGGAKGPFGDQGSPGEHAGDRIHHCGFQRLVEGQRGQ